MNICILVIIVTIVDFVIIVIIVIIVLIVIIAFTVHSQYLPSFGNCINATIVIILTTRGHVWSL